MSDNSSANQRIARNSIFLSIRMIIVLLVGLYTTRAVLSLLGVEDYGIYNVVCGFVSMFAFLNTSMINANQRFYNYEYGKNGDIGACKVFNTSLSIQIILAVIVVVITESFGLWYLHNKMVIPEIRMVAAEWIFHFSLLSFVFVILQVPFGAAIMAHERMDYYAFVQVLDALLKLGIVFIVPLFKSDKLIIYGILWSLISAFDFLMYSIYSAKQFAEITIIRLFDKKLFSSMLSFSGWNLFGSLSGVMREQGISLVMNLFFGPIVNAARGVASQVNGGLQGFAANITVPVRPQVVQSFAKGDYERTFALTYSVSKLSCFILYFIGLPLIMELEYVLNLWLGGNIPNHTSVFIVIIFATTMVSMLNSAISNIVHASGKMALYQSVGGIIGISSVPVAYLFLKNGGTPESAMLVAFAVMAIGHTVGLYILKTIVDFSIKQYLFRAIFPICFVILSTCWIPLIIKSFIDDGIWRFLIIGITCVIINSFSIYYFGLNKSEKSLIKGCITKVLRNRI